MMIPIWSGPKRTRFTGSSRARTSFGFGHWPTPPPLRQPSRPSHLAGRPPFGQPHTRRFHFAPAKTRPPPAPSGWPSNEGRAVVSGTRRIGLCRLCGGAHAGFGVGGGGGRHLPNPRRGRIESSLVEFGRFCPRIDRLMPPFALLESGGPGGRTFARARAAADWVRSNGDGRSCSRSSRDTRGS